MRELWMSVLWKRQLWMALGEMWMNQMIDEVLVEKKIKRVLSSSVLATMCFSGPLKEHRPDNKYAMSIYMP